MTGEGKAVKKGAGYVWDEIYPHVVFVPLSCQPPKKRDEGMNERRRLADVFVGAGKENLQTPRDF